MISLFSVRNLVFGLLLLVLVGVSSCSYYNNDLDYLPPQIEVYDNLISQQFDAAPRNKLLKYEALAGEQNTKNVANDDVVVVEKDAKVKIEDTNLEKIIIK